MDGFVTTGRLLPFQSGGELLEGLFAHFLGSVVVFQGLSSATKLEAKKLKITSRGDSVRGGYFFLGV